MFVLFPFVISHVVTSSTAHDNMASSLLLTSLLLCLAPIRWQRQISAGAGASDFLILAGKRLLPSSSGLVLALSSTL